jgi:hypothetical protein
MEFVLFVVVHLLFHFYSFVLLFIYVFNLLSHILFTFLYFHSSFT